MYGREATKHARGGLTARLQKSYLVDSPRCVVCRAGGHKIGVREDEGGGTRVGRVRRAGQEAEDE